MNVDLRVLREAIQKVRHTISKDKSVAAYQWILFRDRKITTFDGNTATITASTIPELECAVLGSKFVTMLDVLNDGRSAQFELVKGWLKVKAGHYETKIPTFDLRDYPTLAISGSEMFCEATNLISAMKTIKPSIEKEDKGSPISGVGMRGKFIYATDGKRITRARLNKPVESEISISKTGSDQLVRMGQPDHLFRLGTMIGGLYTSQKTLVMTRTLTATFPYDAVDDMFKPGKYSLTLDVPADLLESVERVRALADDDETSLHLESDGKTLIITTISDTGSAKDVIRFACKKPFKIKVQADRLRASLRTLKPKTIDLSDVIYGDARMLLFSGEDYQHCMALMT